MNSWLKRFRIADSLDARRPLPAPLQDAIIRDEELRRFAHETAAVDDALRKSKPELKTTAGLHSSIMRAVRGQAEVSRQPRIVPWLRWLAAPAATALVLAGVWLVIHPAAGPEPRPASPELLGAPAVALELPHQIARTVPAEMLAPLSEELDRVNRDLDRTKEFLIASLP